MNPAETNRLRGPLLRSVSRSFYLSLRILPGTVRDPLSLAYLLARAADTIADTPVLPGELRIERLRDLAGAIQGDAPIETAVRIRDSFASLQSHEGERDLIQSLPAVLQWLQVSRESDRREMREVLGKINQGQILDLERFGGATLIRALSTAVELDEYTYLVAGCVGEFWTRLCFNHIQNFCNRSELEMLALSVEYGKGLQLINILRDLGSDLRAGRCYLPADELISLGVDPIEIRTKAGQVEPVLRNWRERAKTGLKSGVEYACAIQSRRTRFATALPALIGAKTLSLLGEAGTDVFERTIKIPRAEVRKIMFSTALSFASPTSLRRTFERSNVINSPFRTQGAAVSEPPY